MGSASLDASAAREAEVVARDDGRLRDGARCYWDPAWGCDPFDADSCGEAQTCVVTDPDTIAPQSECRPAGPRTLGMTCDDDVPADRCGRALLCVRGRCTASCCGSFDDPRCAARAAGSTCAVPSLSLRVLGCTVPGSCDYRADDCAAGQVCAPSGVHGAATCVAAGEGRENSSCADDNRCAPAFTCLISFPSVVGRCHLRCNPRSPTPCPGRCVPFADRPVDYGVCEPLS